MASCGRLLTGLLTVMTPARRLTTCPTLLALFLAAAPAQDRPKIGLASIVVFGTVQQGDDVKLVDRGGGFYVDKRHVVTSLFACCGKTKDGKTMCPVIIAPQKPAPRKTV